MEQIPRKIKSKKVVKNEIEKRKLYNLNNKEMVKAINETIKNEINRKGLWRTKNQNTDIKYRKYCENCNGINTDGGWKNKVYSVGKSQIQRRIENGELKPNWCEVKRKEIKIITHEAVILYDKDTGNCDAYECEIEKYKGEIIAKIIYGRRKLKVKVHHETIDNEMIIGVALENKARIYVIDEIL